ncbi:unnamed protein product [Meloidogyne enterolobii]|uniref:Uncharacterized protein n=1 Tax=Meloidogyne enterolobii TaxID=390850 RepID=A0ACB0YRM0_MELEN
MNGSHTHKHKCLTLIIALAFGWGEAFLINYMYILSAGGYLFNYFLCVAGWFGWSFFLLEQCLNVLEKKRRRR